MKPCFAAKSTEFTKHYSCTKKPINNVCPVYMLNLLFTLIFVVVWGWGWGFFSIPELVHTKLRLAPCGINKVLLN